MFDRTSVDGVAYLRRAGVPVPADIDAAARGARPDVVFELEVLAGAFDDRRATGRSSSLADAREIGVAIHQAYRDYGLTTVPLGAEWSVAERGEAVLRAVAALR